jgi:sugar phosphate permease
MLPWGKLVHLRTVSYFFVWDSSYFHLTAYYVARKQIINCHFDNFFLAGAAAQDLGGSKNSSSAAGFINGMGSIGSALQGLLIAFAASYGWHAVFNMLVLLSIISIVVILPEISRAMERKNLETR